MYCNSSLPRTRHRVVVARRSASTMPARLREPLLLTSGKTMTSGPIERSKLPLRWLVLFLCSLFLMCSCYCYDNPAALYAQLSQQFNGLDGFDYWFDAMYSVYSLPNIALPLIGGILIDHVGLYRSLYTFAVLLLIGQITFAVGASMSSMPVMLAGRFIFGLGGESITVAQTALVERWFSGGDEVAFSMGLSLSLSRVGSVINNVVSPRIANATLSTAAPIWVGVGLCAVCLGCCICLGGIDRQATSKIRANEALQLVASPPASRFVLSPPPPAVSAFGSPRVTRPDRVAKKATEADSATGAAEGTASALRKTLSTALRASVAFPRAFWLLSLCCVVIYSTVLPFNNIASALLLYRDAFPLGSRWPLANNHTYVYSTTNPHPPHVNCGTAHGARTPFCKALSAAEVRAGIVMSEPYLMSAILTPIIGATVDRYGRRADVVLLSGLCLLLTHLLFSFTSVPAEILLIGMGIGYSVFGAVIWPAIPAIVEKRLLGTAYGMTTVLQNCGLMLVPLAVGTVYDISHTGAPPIDPNPYAGVTLFFAGLAAVGVFFALLLSADPATRRALNTPGGVMPSATPSPTSSPVSSPPPSSISPFDATNRLKIVASVK